MPLLAAMLCLADTNVLHGKGQTAVWRPLQGPRSERKELVVMKYRVHRFELRMTTDQSKLEQFLNSLEGEVVAIIPNVAIAFMWAYRVDFLLIIEKLG